MVVKNFNPDEFFVKKFQSHQKVFKRTIESEEGTVNWYVNRSTEYNIKGYDSAFVTELSFCPEDNVVEFEIEEWEFTKHVFYRVRIDQNDNREFMISVDGEN